jgi:hypothetical protein
MIQGTKSVESPDDLCKEDLVRFLMDLFHRTMVHHGLWLNEAIHQFGMERALEAMKTAYARSYKIQMERLSQVFGFDMENGIPTALLDLPKEKLIDLTRSAGVNWLANDGVWFQAIETARDLNDAKRCNDSCWGRFSAFEAASIKNFLGLPEQAGLDGLKKAFRFRIYARVNTQSIIDEPDGSVVFQMNECRVQSARKRKGLQDYPCKSGGLVEYRTFAESIDRRIRCECVGCPPDPHPEDWVCAWRFFYNEGEKQ